MNEEIETNKHNQRRYSSKGKGFKYNRKMKKYERHIIKDENLVDKPYIYSSQFHFHRIVSQICFRLFYVLKIAFSLVPSPLLLHIVLKNIILYIFFSFLFHEDLARFFIHRPLSLQSVFDSYIFESIQIAVGLTKWGGNLLYRNKNCFLRS